MKLLRHFITIVSTTAAFVSSAAEQPTANPKGAVDQPTAAELQPLQGTWEGVETGSQPHQKIAITITGNSFHFHRDTNFWFETTITLPARTDPKQLHATIKRCPPSQADSIGKVVAAIFKIEDETLILVTRGDSGEQTPKSFEVTEDKGVTRYELRKVQAQKKSSESPQAK